MFVPATEITYNYEKSIAAKARAGAKAQVHTASDDELCPPPLWCTGCGMPCDACECPAEDQDDGGAGCCIVCGEDLGECKCGTLSGGGWRNTRVPGAIAV